MINICVMKVFDTDRVRRIAERVNKSSNADFVKRLLDERRAALRNPDGSVSTHELAYRTDDMGNAVVYPMVQGVGTGVHRFEDPMAFDRALYRGDTLMMPAPDAKLFTEGYKEVYPGFDQYAPVEGLKVGSRYGDPYYGYGTNYTFDGGMYNPYSEAVSDVALSALDPVKDAARRIMAVENSKSNPNGGWNEKEKRWYPHKSVEGGADTIGYGIKLSNGTPEAKLALSQGYLTDEQAEHFVDTLAQKYYDAAKRVYDKRYGEGEWDKLSDKSQSILVDYSYNPGLQKFPSLMEGFHSGNMDMIRKHYKRYTGGKELGRNKKLLEEIDTLENEYPIFRAEGGKLYRMGGPEEDGIYLGELQPSVKLAEEPLYVDAPYTRDDFFKRWYPNRRNQLIGNMAEVLRDRSSWPFFAKRRAEKSVDGYTRSFLKNMDENLKEYALIPSIWDRAYPHNSAYDPNRKWDFPDALKDDEARFVLESHIRSKNDVLKRYGADVNDKITDSDLRAEAYDNYGFSYKGWPYHIFYSSAWPSDDTVVHERSHTIRPIKGEYDKYSTYFGLTPMEYATRQIERFGDGLLTEAGKNKNNRSYYTSPQEIVARLNEVRFNLGLNPNRTITLDDLKEIREKASKDDRENFLDLFTDETLLRFFNEIADAGNPESLYENHLGNISAYGGNIHIKPSHRGRLTELKKRTGKSEAELYNDGNPAHKKMVVFARNARKWKHGDGGPLDKYGDDAVREALAAFREKNKFQEGGDVEPKNTEEYINRQREAARIAAHENSLNQKHQVVPIMGVVNGNPIYGDSCLYTALDNYGDGRYRVAGNVQFANDPEKYGFIRVPVKEVLPGDVVQRGGYNDFDPGYVPTHGMIFDGYDENGKPLFNYSRGSHDPNGPSDIRTHSHYQTEPLDDFFYRAYRFVGLPEDAERWSGEYRERYPARAISPYSSSLLPPESFLVKM